MTDNPSPRRGSKDKGQLSVWGPEPEATPTVPASPKRAPRSHRRFAHINPAMAGWARMTANITVETAAKRFGIKIETLLSWETGTGKPSIPQLRRLAKLYHRPMAAFFSVAVAATKPPAALSSSAVVPAPALQPGQGTSLPT